MRALERVDVRAGRSPRTCSRPSRASTRLISPAIAIAIDHVDPRVAQQPPRAPRRTRRRSGPASAPSAGRSRAASPSRRGCRPRAAPTPSPANSGTTACSPTAPRSGLRVEELDRGSRRRSRRRSPRSPPRTAGSRSAAARGSRTRRSPVSTRRDEQARPEQQVEADRRAEELGQVGRHRDHLGLDPEQRTRCGARTARGRPRAGCWPVAIPSFADSVWISIAIRFEATITQTSV